MVIIDGFASARLKMKRANEHIAQLETLIGTLPDSYVISEQLNARLDHTQVIYKCPEKFVSDSALIIGDAIHNLWCALDHSYVATVLKHAPSAKSEHTRFPWRPIRNKLEQRLKGIKINTLSPSLYDLVTSHIKPFEAADGGNSLLEYLHHLETRDKHELIIPTLHIAQIDGLSIQDEHGVTSISRTGALFGRGEITFLVRREAKINDHGKLSVKVVLDYRAPFQGFPATEVLKHFAELVLGIVDAFDSI